jgi:hypothetical protein
MLIVTILSVNMLIVIMLNDKMLGANALIFIMLIFLIVKC